MTDDKRRLSGDEINMLEQLGMKLELAGDILTVSFPKTGYHEDWIAAELPLEQLAGRETLTIHGRLFVRIETVPA